MAPAEIWAPCIASPPAPIRPAGRRLRTGRGLVPAVRRRLAGGEEAARRSRVASGSASPARCIGRSPICSASAPSPSPRSRWRAIFTPTAGAARIFVLTYVTAALVALSAAFAARLPAGARAPGARLLPLGDPAARFLHRWLVTLATIGTSRGCRLRRRSSPACSRGSSDPGARDRHADGRAAHRHDPAGHPLVGAAGRYWLIGGGFRAARGCARCTSSSSSTSWSISALRCAIVTGSLQHLVCGRERPAGGGPAAARPTLRPAWPAQVLDSGDRRHARHRRHLRRAFRIVLARGASPAAIVLGRDVLGCSARQGRRLSHALFNLLTSTLVPTSPGSWPRRCSIASLPTSGTSSLRTRPRARRGLRSKIHSGGPGRRHGVMFSCRRSAWTSCRCSPAPAWSALRSASARRRWCATSSRACSS